MCNGTSQSVPSEHRDFFYAFINLNEKTLSWTSCGSASESSRGRTFCGVFKHHLRQKLVKQMSHLSTWAFEDKQIKVSSFLVLSVYQFDKQSFWQLQFFVGIPASTPKREKIPTPFGDFWEVQVSIQRLGPFTWPDGSFGTSRQAELHHWFSGDSECHLALKPWMAWIWPPEVGHKSYHLKGFISSKVQDEMAINGRRVE